MARRATAGPVGYRVPGLRSALAEHWELLDERFAGCNFGQWATDARSGVEFEVDGLAIWLALFPVDPKAAAQFENDSDTWTILAGADEVLSGEYRPRRPLPGRL